MALLRKSPLLSKSLDIKHTVVDLSASLVERKTKKGRHLFIEDMSTMGIIYSTGIKNSDRLISLNYVDVQKKPFDEILQAFYSLKSIMMGLERHVDGEVVNIMVAIELEVTEDHVPYLKFSGFYMNTTTVDVKRYCPLSITTLNNYMPDGRVENSQLAVDDGNYTFRLQVEEEPFQIKFTRSHGTSTRFTVHKFVPSTGGSELAVILVPKDYPDQCIAVTANNELQLVPFEQPSSTVLANCSFFELSQEPNNRYLIESVVNRGNFVEKEGTDAVLGPVGSQFEWTSSEVLGCD